MERNLQGNLGDADITEPITCPNLPNALGSSSAYTVLFNLWIDEEVRKEAEKISASMTSGRGKPGKKGGNRSSNTDATKRPPKKKARPVRKRNGEKEEANERRHLLLNENEDFTTPFDTRNFINTDDDTQEDDDTARSDEDDREKKEDGEYDDDEESDDEIDEGDIVLSLDADFIQIVSESRKLEVVDGLCLLNSAQIDSVRIGLGLYLFASHFIGCGATRLSQNVSNSLAF